MNWLERFWSGCGHCRGPEDCPLAKGLDGASSHGSIPTMSAGLFAVSVMAVFLLPLIFAMAGGYLAGRWVALTDGITGLFQDGGMVVGAVVGIAVAKALTRSVHSNCGTDADDSGVG